PHLRSLHGFLSTRLKPRVHSSTVRATSALFPPEHDDMKDSADEAGCIHHLFEKQVHATPSAIAFLFDRQRLTYEQLNRRANQVARALQARGSGPATLVGVCLDRSLDIGVALLGILKAGAAYVP